MESWIPVRVRASSNGGTPLDAAWVQGQDCGLIKGLRDSGFRVLVIKCIKATLLGFSRVFGRLCDSVSNLF